MVIKKTVEKIINKQINAEEFSARLYLSMSSWCEVNGYAGFAAYFQKQYREEIEHMMRFFKYLNNRGGHALIDAVEKPQQEFKDINEVVEMTYEHELKVTEMIHEIYEVAKKEKDYATENMIQWYIAEQVEEEETFSGLLSMMKLAGKANMYEIDKYMGKRAQ